MTTHVLIVISGRESFYLTLGFFGFDFESDNDGQRCCECPEATTSIATQLVHTCSLQQLFEAHNALSITKFSIPLW